MATTALDKLRAQYTPAAFAALLRSAGLDEARRITATLVESILAVDADGGLAAYLRERVRVGDLTQCLAGLARSRLREESWGPRTRSRSLDLRSAVLPDDEAAYLRERVRVSDELCSWAATL